MIDEKQTFDGTWPFAPQFSTAAGFRQHYVDEGPRDGEVIVCLHGEPTWGYLYRNFIPSLAKDYRVIVPDHMGFGKSETPQDRVYTLQTHVENLEKLIDDLDLNDITFVCQDWGGPITGAYTIRHPERVKRVFLMNTLFGYGGATPPAEKTSLVSVDRTTRGSRQSARNPRRTRLNGALGHEDHRLPELGRCRRDLDSRLFRAVPGSRFLHRSDRVPLGRALQPLPEIPARGAANRQPRRGEGQARDAGVGRHGISESRRSSPSPTSGPSTPRPPSCRSAGVGHFCQEDAPETLVALIQGFVQAN